MMSLVFIFLCSHLISAVIIREYNNVTLNRFFEYDELMANFFPNEERAKNNFFLGVFEPQCEETLMKLPQFTGIQRLAGGDVIEGATLPKSQFPLLTTGCAEVFFWKIQTSFHEPTSTTTELEQRPFTSWSVEQTRTSVQFYNEFPYEIELFWVDEANEGVSQNTYLPGASSTIGTFIGHTFMARRVHDRLIVDFMVANGQDYFLSPMNRLETCDTDGDGYFVSQLACDDMDGRFTEFTHRVWHQKRLGLNYLQPQIVHAVTDSGFRHIQLPNATFTWLREWYDNMRSQAVNEGSGGPCMNQHVAPAAVAHITSAEKSRLADELKPIMEDWYGGPLYMTSIYGIRKYVNGSILRMHVDTVATHVVSAIINVDQDVQEDWDLLILDHEDNEHSVRMRPGDMVLYESAKLLHGRPKPFKGAHYDNIFAHYRPVNKEEWAYDWV